MSTQKVLFLCTGNSARSQMAEAFLRKYAAERFDVSSAGLEPKDLNPFARQAMEELGIDMTGHFSKSLDEFLDKGDFDYLITVCDHAAANCPFFPGSGTRLHWSFEDPASFEGTDEEKLAKFREVRDLIKDRIIVWLAETA
ncbi:MAG: arsenate reductase ArsC [Thermodesulfobacteriota bacterium]